MISVSESLPKWKALRKHRTQTRRRINVASDASKGVTLGLLGFLFSSTDQPQLNNHQTITLLMMFEEDIFFRFLNLPLTSSPSWQTEKGSSQRTGANSVLAALWQKWNWQDNAGAGEPRQNASDWAKPFRSEDHWNLLHGKKRADLVCNRANATSAQNLCQASRQLLEKMIIENNRFSLKGCWHYGSPKPEG